MLRSSSASDLGKLVEARPDAEAGADLATRSRQRLSYRCRVNSYGKGHSYI